MSTMMIVLIIFGVLGLLCCGICGGCLYFGANSAGPLAYMGAVLPKIQTDPTVQEKFGSPIQPLGMPSGSKLDLSPGAKSTVEFEISGPKGKGKVHAEVTNTPNGIEPAKIEVTAPDGTVINVSGETDKTDINIPDLDMEEEK